jgi:hypothetical protein
LERDWLKVEKEIIEIIGLKLNEEGLTYQE